MNSMTRTFVSVSIVLCAFNSAYARDLIKIDEDLTCAVYAGNVTKNKTLEKGKNAEVICQEIGNDEEVGHVLQVYKNLKRPIFLAVKVIGREMYQVQTQTFVVLGGREIGSIAQVQFKGVLNWYPGGDSNYFLESVTKYRLPLRWPIFEERD